MLTDTHGKPFAGRVFTRATLENALRSDWTVQILNTENEHFNCFFNLQAPLEERISIRGPWATSLSSI